MLRNIQIDWADLPQINPLEPIGAAPEAGIQPPENISADNYPEFLEHIGLVGMGGSQFPTSVKIKASTGAHTLAINGVECEPGITIDMAVLLNHSKWVIAGAEASATAVGASRIVLAVKNEPQHIVELKKLYPFDILTFSRRYPAGAEKLIITKLTGKMPPPGVLPFQMGYLVQNVVSLRAIGRALLDGIAVVERPLTVAIPAKRRYRNIIAPVGVKVGEILTTVAFPYDPELHLLAAGGMMMGKEVSADDHIEKGTTSLLVLNRSGLERKERDCIRCGACFNACPLGLHPISLVEHVQVGSTTSPAFRAQMTECFLCGACSAVCPSHIPLVQGLKEGKLCLKNRQS